MSRRRRRFAPRRRRWWPTDGGQELIGTWRNEGLDLVSSAPPTQGIDPALACSDFASPPLRPSRPWYEHRNVDMRGVEPRMSTKPSAGDGPRVGVFRSRCTRLFIPRGRSERAVEDEGSRLIGAPAQGMGPALAFSDVPAPAVSFLKGGARAGTGGGWGRVQPSHIPLQGRRAWGCVRDKVTCKCSRDFPPLSTTSSSLSARLLRAQDLSRDVKRTEDGSTDPSGSMRLLEARVPTRFQDLFSVSAASYTERRPPPLEKGCETARFSRRTAILELESRSFRAGKSRSVLDSCQSQRRGLGNVFDNVFDQPLSYQAHHDRFEGHPPPFGRFFVGTSYSIPHTASATSPPHHEHLTALWAASKRPSTDGHHTNNNTRRLEGRKGRVWAVSEHANHVPLVVDEERGWDSNIRFLVDYHYCLYVEYKYY
ncbi:hypothetical protein FPV67DRAFT_1456416 [Lyophyllum atratum]|nr:hypothetical protein FPV67DRAFT_1456416 [Lyophyllum atratum]